MNGAEERVRRAVERLRELEASGVNPVEILASEAGAVFVRDYCGGDPDVASAAFALVHSPSRPGYKRGRDLPIGHR